MFLAMFSPFARHSILLATVLMPPLSWGALSFPSFCWYVIYISPVIYFSMAVTALILPSSIISINRRSHSSLFTWTAL